MTHENSLQSRTSSPSLSDRVRSITGLGARLSSASRSTLADELDADTILAEESDHGTSTPERTRSDANIFTGDHIFDQLQPSRSITERTTMIEQVAENAASYPIPVLMSIWTTIRDMYREKALPDARRACFLLARAIADLPNVTMEMLQQLYRVIVEPAPIEVLVVQMASLNSLTRRGTRIAPFSSEIGKFLTATLQRHSVLVSEARKRSKSQGIRDPATPTRERGFSQLLTLIACVEGHHPGTIQDEEQRVLLLELFAIAERTSSPKDMKGVVGVLSPIIQGSGLPVDLRNHCVELLCAIFNAVEDVREDTKASIFFLLRSDCQQDVKQILLDTLSLALSERHNSIVCGALGILLKLIQNRGQNNLPLITFGQFIAPFSKVHHGSRSTRAACLKTISDLLGDQALLDDILGSDWKYMIDTILTATGDEIYKPGQRQPLSIESQKKKARSSSTPDTEPHKDQLRQKRLAIAISDHLGNIASSFNSLWLHLNKDQRELVARFYCELVYILSQGYLLHLIHHILSLKLSPSMADQNGTNLIQPKLKDLPRTNYYACMDELIDMFMFEHRIPPRPYGRIMEGLRKDLISSSEEGDEQRIQKLSGYVLRLLTEFNDIQDSGWQKAVELAKTVAVSWKLSLPTEFERILELMTPLIHSRADDEDRETSQEEDSASLYTAHHGLASVTLSLVEVFLHLLPIDSHSSSLLFDKFLKTASDRTLPASVRFPALRLLARIRCDQRRSIFITTDADGLSLAQYLRRTESTRHQLATFKEGAPQGNATLSRRSNVEGGKDLRRSRKSAEFFNKPIPKAPLWMYPGGPGLPSDPPPYPSPVCRVHLKEAKDTGSFNMNNWLSVVMDILQNETEWEVYSYVIVHLPSQLLNASLFTGSIPAIKMLRSIIVGQLFDNKFMEPPAETHVKKGDVAFCLMQTLFILYGYADRFSQGEQDEMVKAILHGIGTWDRTGQICVQALAVACYALPVSIRKSFGAILLKLERYITHTNLTVDILEFLSGVARMRDIHVGLLEKEYRKVFAICIKYLEFAREQRSKLVLNNEASRDYTSDRWSGLPAPYSIYNNSTIGNQDQDIRHKHLPQYVFVLAYHVMTFWFLAIKLSDRSKYVGWISSKLAWEDVDGIERMEEQSQVTLDMMLRTAYSDTEESKLMSKFTEADGLVCKKTWLVGLSILSIETAAKTGLTQITKRQVSGTTYATYFQQTAPLPTHHSSIGENGGREAELNIFPHHIFLQLTTSIAPTPSPLEPIALPDDILVKRALETFDRMDTVDGYRIGVVCLRDGQSKESEILSNDSLGKRFGDFMCELGTLVQLKDASFNTQGLDHVSDEDGPYTYAWRDRLVEIIYHVPVLMPNREDDPHFTNKKRHIGNNHVTIVWNESGLPFEFDTIPSSFNSVMIVVTPENSQCASSPDGHKYTVPNESDGEQDVKPQDLRYTVQTITHQSFPRLSPCASAKLLPLTHLPALVRQTALNSAIFSNVWLNREDGEYASSWRNRLREIVKLRERYGNSSSANAGNSNSDFPGARGSRVYGPGDLFKGKIEMGGITEEDGILGTLDFSRWAGVVTPSLQDQVKTTSRSSSSAGGHGHGTGQRQ